MYGWFEKTNWSLWNCLGDDETFKSLLFWKAKQCMFLFHSSSPDWALTLDIEVVPLDTIAFYGDGIPTSSVMLSSKHFI